MAGGIESSYFREHDHSGGRAGAAPVVSTLKLNDTSADHTLTVQVNENLTADRTLNLVTGDGTRTVTLSGNPTMGDWFDQSVKSTARPTLAGSRMGASPDYTKFSATGHQTMTGAARPWRDALMDAVSLQQSGPGVSRHTGQATVAFASNSNLSDFLYGNIQLNHDKDLSSSVHLHVHWFQGSKKRPNFLVQYRWQVNGGTKTKAWTSAIRKSMVTTYSAGTLDQIYRFGGVSPPAGSTLSDIIQIKLFRDTNNDSGLFASTDPYVGSVHVTAFDAHFMINSLGSDTEYTK